MNVVIAGSGISGLAAAISLRRCGHKVTIYEKSSMNNEIGAAINVPPNAARILVPWGLDPVKAGFIEGKGIYFMSPTTNEQLNFVDQSDYAEVYGQGLWYAHRVDLHESLKQMATAVDGPGVPAKIIVKSGVINYVSHKASMPHSLVVSETNIEEGSRDAFRHSQRWKRSRL